MQALVRFYADNRIKQHASLRLLRNRLIFLFSTLTSYSQGGMVIALATLHSILLYKIYIFTSKSLSKKDRTLI